MAIHAAAPIDLRILQMTATGIELNYGATELAEHNLSALHQKMVLLSAEFSERVKEGCKHEERINSFNTYTRVITYIAGTANIGFGAGMLKAGATKPGSLLLASGMLAMANQIMVDTGGWKALAGRVCDKNDLNAQEKWAAKAQVTCLAVSTTLGALGWWYAAPGLKAMGVATGSKTVMGVLSGSGQMAKAVGTAAQTVNTSNLHEVTAAKIELMGKFKHIKGETDDLMNRLEETVVAEHEKSPKIAIAILESNAVIAQLIRAIIK